jgi:hypothetical protein
MRYGRGATAALHHIQERAWSGLTPRSRGHARACAKPCDVHSATRLAKGGHETCEGRKIEGSLRHKHAGEHSAGARATTSWAEHHLLQETSTAERDMKALVPMSAIH